MSRHGSIFHGPRLILALIAVTLLFFYLRQPLASSAGIVRVETHHYSRPDSTPENALQSEKEEHGHAGAEKPDSLSDKLFDYLKGHAPHVMPTGWDKNKHDSSVPFAEHAPKPQYGEEASTSGSNASTASQTPPRDPICAHIPDTSDILLVVRAPASDLYTHIPSHYLTFLRCVDAVVFSTVSHDLGGYTVHDSLANVSTTVKKEKDFELYEKLREAQQAGLEFEFLKEDNDHNLDKWGIIPSILEAYQMHPEKKWFMIIESDSYISLPNLANWIKQLDPSKPLYSGAQVMIGDMEFAHSGSGILLSQPAVKKLAEAAPSKMSEWEEALKNTCCGDKTLAEAFKSLNISLHRSFPVLQGETPYSLDWSNRHWCKAAVTWHRMMPQSIDMLWRAERKWWSQHQSSASSSPTQSPPLLYKDLFSLLLLDVLRAHPNRSQWDNLANSYTYTDDSRAQFAHFSFEACRAACDLRGECLQYAWEPNKCRIGTVVRIGEPVEISEKTRGSDRERMISGWSVPRVEKWVSKQEGKCEGESAWLLPDGKEELLKDESVEKGMMDVPPSPSPSLSLGWGGSHASDESDEHQDASATEAAAPTATHDIEK
jgi:hypothetical protein